MTEEMTHRLAVDRAWRFADEARHLANDGHYPEADTLARLAQAWAAVASQLPFVEPRDEILDSRTLIPVPPIPRPLERKLIGPPHAHLDAPCTDACYESVVPQQCACGDGDPRGHVHLPVPRRTEPTNTRTVTELQALEREQEAADAALRGEPVPDPRAAPGGGWEAHEPADYSSSASTCARCIVPVQWNGGAWTDAGGGARCVAR